MGSPGDPDSASPAAAGRRSPPFGSPIRPSLGTHRTAGLLLVAVPELRYGTYRTLIHREGPGMRANGIGYDTGFEVGGTVNRPFEPELVRRELRIIRDDLHCTAVRLIGT